MPAISPETQEAAYDVLAPFYDALTDGHDYELWVGALLTALEAAGLTGRAVLDVGCGTAKSSLPFLRRGFEVTGVDVSGPMLRAAARRAPDARLMRGDMRELPVLGSFDLVVCLDDGVNYLCDTRELAAALGGMGRNLRPGGLLIFDTNTLRAYREHFTETSVVRSDDELVLLWQGQTPRDLQAGQLATLIIDAFVPAGGHWQRHRSHHVQRHHPDEEVRHALEAAGLRLVDTAGHGFDAVLERPGDPSRHTKLIYIAQRGQPAAPDHKEVKEQCCPSCTPASRWPLKHPSSREAETGLACAAHAAQATPAAQRP